MKENGYNVVFNKEAGMTISPSFLCTLV